MSKLTSSKHCKDPLLTFIHHPTTQEITPCDKKRRATLFLVLAKFSIGSE
jgi:hypothetical protein